MLFASEKTRIWPRASETAALSVRDLSETRQGEQANPIGVCLYPLVRPSGGTIGRDDHLQALGRIVRAAGCSRASR